MLSTLSLKETHVKSNMNSFSSNQSLTTVTSFAATITVTAALATTTITASDGCPPGYTNASTYDSVESSKYTIFCNSDITPGSNLGSKNATSLDNCLDECMGYTSSDAVGSTGACRGATWVAYSADDESLTGKCFFKSSQVVLGNRSSTGDIIAAVGVLQLS